MIPRIENEYLRVEANLLGGSLTSLFRKSDGEEFLYQKEPDSWQGQDIAIFPFVARLKGKTYTHEGKEYSLRNHGLCRYYSFDVIENDGTCMKLAFRSNEETLKEYPFPFLFEITYRLEGATFAISYDIQNLGTQPMRFGLGAHPAFRVDPKDGADTSGNYVVLPKKVALTRIVFDEKGEFVCGEEEFGEIERIETTKELFQRYKTLAVKGEGIDRVRLIRSSGKTLDFEFDNIVYLILWSFPESGAFVAIEPWMSLPDFEDAPKELFEKKTLLALAPSEKYHFSYRIKA